MKILTVTHYFESHRGGIEVVAGRIAEKLAARGHGVVWAASDTDDAPTGIQGLAALPMRAWNWTERRLGVPYPLWSPAATRQLVDAVRDADVVHIHDAIYYGSQVAARAALRLNKPLVITQHVGWVPYRSAILRAVLKGATSALTVPILRQASRIVFISQTTRQYFADWPGIDARAVTTANGTDLSTYAPGPGERQSYGLPNDRTVFLFVGRFVEKKGLVLLQQLAKALPDAHFALAGWGPLDPDTWGLANVSVHRGLRGKELAGLYRSADLFVLPSVGEGFPLVVQEAMACGLPCCVDTAVLLGCPSADAPILGLDVQSPEALERWSEALRTWHPDGEMRKTVAEYAVRHWSWDCSVDEYETLFRELLS